MAISVSNNSYAEESQTPLLEGTAAGAVDYKGNPVLRANSGGWRSASFMIGVEVAERFSYFGISCNLITYLTEQLGQSTVTAAENVNAWSGTAQLMPLLGASIADSFLGRYRTIVIATLIYILGLGLLTLSAVLPSLADYVDTNKSMSCCPKLIVILFFFSLYLVAVAQGGHKPCIQAFGADQFDGEDPKERNAKSSFFNWWFLGVCGSAAVTVLALSYIQDNLSWGLGFGIPCILMIIALVIFLLGTRTYRYCIKRDETSPFVRISGVFVAAVRNCHSTRSRIAIEEEACGTSRHSSEQFKEYNCIYMHVSDQEMFNIDDKNEKYVFIIYDPSSKNYTKQSKNQKFIVSRDVEFD